MCAACFSLLFIEVHSGILGRKSNQRDNWNGQSEHEHFEPQIEPITWIPRLTAHLLDERHERGLRNRV